MIRKLIPYAILVVVTMLITVFEWWLDRREALRIMRETGGYPVIIRGELPLEKRMEEVG